VPVTGSLPKPVPDGAVSGWLALGDDGRGFLRGLKPGRYRLDVTIPGCAPLELDVEVEEKPNAPLVLTLTPK